MPPFLSIFIKYVFLSADWPETQYKVHTAHELTVILLPLPSGVTQFWGVYLYYFHFILLLGLNLGPEHARQALFHKPHPQPSEGPVCVFYNRLYSLGLYGHYPSFIHHKLIRVIISTLQIRNVCFVYLWYIYTQVVYTCVSSLSFSFFY